MHVLECLIVELFNYVFVCVRVHVLCVYAFIGVPRCVRGMRVSGYGGMGAWGCGSVGV